ncbi:hypothetical protein GCM10009676_45530 [Prauserella halophila]|uniref:SnoaL-like domain-containing protein n=1 Tax=Prauserella halophila TaxID=185641 RepID=A0ABP4HD06_9PSEU
MTFGVDVGPVTEGDLISARWVAHGHYQAAATTFHGHDILRHDTLRHGGNRFVEYWVIAETP